MLAGAHVAGSFNGWTPTEMEKVDGSTYGLSVDVKAGVPVRYMFVKCDGMGEDDWEDLQEVELDEGGIVILLHSALRLW